MLFLHQSGMVCERDTTAKVVLDFAAEKNNWLFSLYYFAPLYPIDGVNIESQIIQLLAEGDKRAIALLYDHYSGALYGYALRMVGNEEAASDVLQMSFVKVWKNAHRFDAQKAKLYTWLVSIVRNTALDELRKSTKKQDREVQIDKSNVDIGETHIVPEHIDVKDHVSKLDEKYRVVIDALYFQGMSQSEASEALEMPLGTIKTRVKIGLRELRKLYVDHTMELLLALWWIGQQL